MGTTERSRQEIDILVYPVERQAQVVSLLHPAACPLEQAVTTPQGQGPALVCRLNACSRDAIALLMVLVSSE